MPVLQSVSFRFEPVDAPIGAPITKFGGQPVWIAPPAWPLGPATGAPMRFLGQIALTDPPIPGGAGRLAHLFLEDVSEPLPADAVAIVLQERDRTVLASAPSVPVATGPTLFRLDEERNERPLECRAVLEPPHVERPLSPEERRDYGDLDYAAGFTFHRPDLAGKEIGGQPLYIEGLDSPPPEYASPDWVLLLQLAPRSGYWGPRFTRNFYPFHLELGEFGILTVFLAADFTAARVHVQQP